mmetsp:Transcript_11367/g.35051  ORF Transcript_11367/g.35051 Transcript_11367/m.35051 type:complete len:264 (+) Transcript_11367:626-1417(+)
MSARARSHRHRCGRLWPRPPCWPWAQEAPAPRTNRAAARPLRGRSTRRRGWRRQPSQGWGRPARRGGCACQWPRRQGARRRATSRARRRRLGASLSRGRPTRTAAEAVPPSHRGARAPSRRRLRVLPRRRVAGPLSPVRRQACSHQGKRRGRARAPAAGAARPSNASGAPTGGPSRRRRRWPRGRVMGGTRGRPTRQARPRHLPPRPLWRDHALAAALPARQHWGRGRAAPRRPSPGASGRAGRSRRSGRWGWSARAAAPRHR